MYWPCIGIMACDCAKRSLENGRLVVEVVEADCGDEVRFPGPIEPLEALEGIISAVGMGGALP